MDYIEVKCIGADKMWTATTISNTTTEVCYRNEDYNVVLDEAYSWARLLQTQVRIIK